MNDERPQRNGLFGVSPANWGIGTAIGLAIGIALGVAMDSIGAGIAIGVGLAVAFALSFGAAADDLATRREPPDADGPPGG